jgi:uncharacterized protein (DUF1810 family)
MAFPVLDSRLRRCCEALLALEGLSVHGIIGSSDDLKLHSCAPLFDQVDEAGSVFEQLKRYLTPKKSEEKSVIAEITNLE